MRVRAREREAGGDGGGYRAIGRWGGGAHSVWVHVHAPLANVVRVTTGTTYPWADLDLVAPVLVLLFRGLADLHFPPLLRHFFLLSQPKAYAQHGTFTRTMQSESQSLFDHY